MSTLPTCGTKMTWAARGPGDPDVSRNELISALHLATMWDLKGVRLLHFCLLAWLSNHYHD